MNVRLHKRLLVSTITSEKKGSRNSAKRLGLTVDELTRLGAIADVLSESRPSKGILATQALAAANRACDAIDEVLSFVEASNQRIIQMEIAGSIGEHRNNCSV